jgi:zona occludens toxin
MIELRTGVPGAGKTLSAVERLAKLQARWDSHPDEARPVFVSGIPDLALPHSEMPLKSVQIRKAGTPSLVPDWDEMPDGSLVIIDEAQGVFPPRSSASEAPAHVAWLNTHRHRGFDIWLTTQHPKLIDASVRALIGKHQHYRRLFGGMRCAVYEWDCCSDSLSGLKTAVISYWSYPRKAFKWYKSAEIHTKQNFKLPRWILIPVLGFVLMLFFFPRAYGVITQSGNSQAKNEPIALKHPEPQNIPEQKNAPSQLAPVAGLPATKQAEPHLIDFRNISRNGRETEHQRPIAKLKISHGVYGDDPEEPAHLTEAQRINRDRNAEILARHEENRRYQATLDYYKETAPIPVIISQ